MAKNYNFTDSSNRDFWNTTMDIPGFDIDYDRVNNFGGVYENINVDTTGVSSGVYLSISFDAEYLWDDVETLDVVMGDYDDYVWLSIDNGSSNVSTTFWLGDGNDYLMSDFYNDNDYDSKDTVYGQGGNDEIYLGNGSDYGSGGSGDDTIYGKDGQDELLGGSGDDFLSGGDGSDSLSGGSGNDYLNGGNGADTITGGSGDDVLVGGSINSSGIDVLTGGDGKDIFVVSEWASSGSSAADTFGADWLTWRGIYASTDVISTTAGVLGMSNPVVSMFFNSALSIGANALATFLTTAADSAASLDASDETYQKITDFSMTDDLVILPTFTGHSFSSQGATVTNDDGTQSYAIEFYYDGQTGKFLELHIDGSEDHDSATGFYADFLDAVGLTASSTTQSTLFDSFMYVMEKSIALISKDSDGNITITQNNQTVTYTDSELDEYARKNWSSFLDDDTSIMLMGSDVGYTAEFDASSDGRFISGGGSTDVFYGVELANAYAYLATFAGNDIYYHKDADYGFYYNGGDDQDTISFEYLEGTSGVTLDLSSELQTDFVGSTDATLVDVENVVGTLYDDDITGDAGNNLFMGLAGNNTLNGGAGYDTVFYYGAMSDYSIGSGTITGSYTDADNNVYNVNDTLSNIEFLTFEETDGLFASLDGSFTDWYIFGSEEADYLVGQDDNDWLYGFGGDDILEGGNTSDYFVGGTGDDEIYGYSSTTSGNYIDTAYYHGSVAEYMVDVVLGNTIQASVTDLNTVSLDEGTDSLESVEVLSFSDGVEVKIYYQDVYAGDSSDNSLSGSSSSNDWLFGGAGDDTLEAGQGNDHLIGGEGDDYLYGRSASNTSSTGTDTAYYAGAVAEFIMSNYWDDYYGEQDDIFIMRDESTDEYDEGQDLLNQIEYVHFGDGATVDLVNDNIVLNTDGTSGNDWIFDQTQDDISANGGDDHVIGSEGNDTINGGNGSDTAYYSASVAEYLVEYISDANLETTVEDIGTTELDEGKDTLTNVETLHFGDGVTIDIASVDIYTGTSSDETLVGDDSTDDWIFGGAGDDKLKGMQGDDHLVGGEGDDIIYGRNYSYTSNTGTDTAYYADELDNYEINFWSSGSGQTWMSIEDMGDDGYDEGYDELRDVEYVSFNGTQYSVLELSAAAVA